MAFVPVAMAASAAISALGTGAQALAAHNSSEFQAKLANIQGQQAREQGAVKASEIARGNKQTEAAFRAGTAQNGFTLTGSMSDLLHQTERAGQLNYLTAVYDGSVAGMGLDASATNYRRQGKNALIGGALGMGAQALGGVTDIAKYKAASINVAGT